MELNFSEGKFFELTEKDLKEKYDNLKKEFKETGQKLVESKIKPFFYKCSSLQSFYVFYEKGLPFKIDWFFSVDSILEDEKNLEESEDTDLDEYCYGIEDEITAELNKFYDDWEFIFGKNTTVMYCSGFGIFGKR